MHAVALAAGEIPHFLLLVCAAEIEGRRVRPRVSGPRADLDVLLAAGDLLPHALRRIKRVARLRNVGELYRIADTQRSPVDLLFAGDEPKERGLAGTVRTDHPDDAAAREGKAQVVEEELVAVRLADALGFDDDVAEARTGRDRDLELALAKLRVFREKAFVRLDARLALRLTRARGCADPLELARERPLASRLLLFLVGEAFAFLLEPRAVVALVRDARTLVELEDPAGHVVEEITVVRDRDDATRILGEMALEPSDRVRIEMVGRLVEEEQVGLGEEEPAERDAPPLATRKGRDVLVAGRAPQRVHRDVDGRVEVPEPLRLDLVLRPL